MSDDHKKPRKTGYKKPPVEHQFQPGTSGNPRGRPPKMERSFMPLQLIRDILAITEETTKIRTPTGMKTLSSIEVILMRMRQRALEGHGPSMREMRRLHSDAVHQYYERYKDMLSFVDLVEDGRINTPGPPSEDRSSRKFVNRLRRRTRRIF